MFTWVKRVVLPVVALALFATVPAVRADSVQFYTSGSFSQGSFNTVTGTFSSSASALGGSPHSGSASVTVDQPINGLTSTLTYTYSQDEVVNLIAGFGNVNGGNGFGFFNVSSQGATGANVDSFNGVQFTLNIFQTVPGSGTGFLVGSLTGQLASNTGPGGTASTLSVTFSPNSVVIPPSGSGQVLYTISPPGGVVTIGGDSNATLITGTVQEVSTTVPLPSTASVGLALLAGLGGLSLLRRRRLTTVVA